MEEERIGYVYACDIVFLCVEVWSVECWYPSIQHKSLYYKTFLYFGITGQINN